MTKQKPNNNPVHAPANKNMQGYLMAERGQRRIIMTASGKLWEAAAVKSTVSSLPPILENYVNYVKMSYVISEEKKKKGTGRCDS